MDLEAEARGEGDTLARHEKILLELAKKLKLNIGAIYREIVSGETIAARPVVQRLLSEVGQGMWEGTLVMEIERLARGETIDQGIVAQAYKYSNTKIITPQKIYDPQNDFDEEYFEFSLFMSRREYKTINRRLQTGRIASVKEGKYLGSVPPYGYTIKRLEKQKGNTLAIVPEQAEVVRNIFHWYTRSENRLGVSLICRRLNEMKIPPAKGDVWVPASIQTILRNPTYAGKVRWKVRPHRKKMVDGQVVKERPRANPSEWIVVDGLHKAIIDWETFELAQQYLSINSSRPCPKFAPIKNPLGGLIICGLCGRKMVRRPHGTRYPDTLMCPNVACQNISTQLSIVEERLLEAIDNWMQNYKLQWKDDDFESSKTADYRILLKSIKRLDDEIATLDKQMNSIHDLLEQGVYTTEVFLDRSKKISDRINELKQAKKELNEQYQAFEQQEVNKKFIIPKIEKVLDIYRTVDDPEIRNQLLHEILEKVIYTKTQRGNRGGHADNFNLVLYPKLNVSKDFNY